MKSTRKFLLISSALVCSALAAAAFVSQSPKAAETANKDEIRAIVKEYLAEHPEIVIEAIEAYQENQQEIEARRFKDAITENEESLIKGDLPFAGNPEGDVVIVEFFDYNCGYCKRATTEIQKLLERDNKVKIIFREMPILRSTSNDAARYSYAAHKQGKYWDYHVALMSSSGGKDEKTLEKLAGDVGLDVEQLRKDANSREIREQVEASLNLSRTLGIRGTPAFIIGDTMVPGYMTVKDMQAIIEKVRNGEG